jgi:hypothetical protein
VLFSFSLQANHTYHPLDLPIACPPAYFIFLDPVVSSCHCLTSSCHCLTSSCNCLPSSCHCLPSTCHCLPRSCHCLPRSCHCLPSSCHCLPSTCHCLPSSCHCLTSSCQCLPRSSLCLYLKPISQPFRALGISYAAKCRRNHRQSNGGRRSGHLTTDRIFQFTSAY